MKISSGKNNDELFTFEDEPENACAFGKSENLHPDALTVDEILNKKCEKPMESSALQSLLKRMNAAVSSENQNNSAEDTANNIQKPMASTPAKAQNLPKSVLSTDSATNTANTSAKPIFEESKTPKENKDEPSKSLLDKCMPYILDDDGNDTYINTKPLYKLQSVAEILKSESERALERLSKEYGITFENTSAPSTSLKEEAPEVSVPDKKEPTYIENKDIQSHSESLKQEVKVSHRFSDIDIPSGEGIETKTKKETPACTVTFTPVTESGEAASKIVVSTHKKPIDLTGELLKIHDPALAGNDEQVHLEKTEFDEYVPDDEFKDLTDAKRLLKKFANYKKSSFFCMSGSVLLTLFLCLLKLPIFSGIILSHTRICMIVAASFVLLSAILNYKIFLKLPKIFSKKATADSSAALAVIAVMIYAVSGIVYDDIILNMLLFISFILTFSAIGRFMKDSQMLRSLKQISGQAPKQAIKLIDDPAITFAMSKGAVEGDTLIAAAQKVNFVSDFIKYSTFGIFLGGNSKIINLASLLLSILTGFLAATYYGGIVHGFYTTAAVQCLTALPCLFFVDTLPLYDSSKKLASVGAMIAGKTGAQQVEQANAAVLNSLDLFPAGTVTLHKMQVLSENDLQDTLIRAASLTEAMQSPLASIFKKIAGESNITVFPDSDTVKYEEGLGLSGWVDNRLLFIGNRTLMEAHEIAVPSVSLDHKILRQGYFPVYVATKSKACALLIVKYNVHERISRELQKLTGAGVTLLIKNSDSNLTEEMICDYLGLYSDSVKVMSSAGCHIFSNTVVPAKTYSAPASFKTNPLGLPTILNCAGRIKRSNILLTTIYVLSAVIGILFFAYSSFGGSGSLLGDTTLLIYGLATTAVSYLIYLTQKP